MTFDGYTYELRYGHYVDIVGVTGSIPVAPTTTFGGASPTTPEEGVSGSDSPAGSLPSVASELLRPTLHDIVIRYRDTVSIRKRGKDVERWVLNAFLRDPIASLGLSELRRSHFVEYRDRRLAQGIRHGSLKRQLDILHHMFEVAREDWELQITNPVDRLKLAGAKKRERRVSPKELLRLKEALSLSRNPYLEPMVMFAIRTGMRLEEMTKIEWSHVREDGLLIPETKNGTARVVPLTRQARTLLEDLQSRRNIKRPFNTTPRAITQAWRRLTKRAGIKDLHFHDLRHEAISSFFEKNLTLPEVASISGHKDMRMLLRYAHADKAKLLAKLEA